MPAPSASPRIADFDGMPAASLDRWALARIRGAIDQLDDAMVRLLAGRRRLVGLAGRFKRHAGLPQRDAAREHDVHRRAARMALRHRVPADDAVQLIALLIAQAHRQQQAPIADSFHSSSLPGTAMPHSPTAPAVVRPLLRWLPPPPRWRPWLAVLPAPLHRAVLLRLLARALSSPEAMRTLAPIQDRRLGIEVDDLGLRWVLELHEGRLRLHDDGAEVTVAGSATDLLLLAGRLEDADTLFFQRRLSLTGDTELGLTLRNLLDRLPWESLPLDQRILLRRAALLARDARSAHRSHAGRAS